MSSANKQKGCQMRTGLQFPVKKLLAAIWTGSPLPGIPRLRPMSRSQITPISLIQSTTTC